MPGESFLNLTPLLKTGFSRSIMLISCNLSSCTRYRWKARLQTYRTQSSRPIPSGIGSNLRISKSSRKKSSHMSNSPGELRHVRTRIAIASWSRYARASYGKSASGLATQQYPCLSANFLAESMVTTGRAPRIFVTPFTFRIVTRNDSSQKKCMVR